MMQKAVLAAMKFKAAPFVLIQTIALRVIFLKTGYNFVGTSELESAPVLSISE